MAFVDMRIAARLELAHARRTVEYARAQYQLSPGLGARVERIGPGWAVYAGPDSPVNGVRGLGLPDPVRPQELDQAECFFGAQKTPTRVTICPLADRSLIELLAWRRYGLERFFSVLTMPISASPVSSSPGPAIEVREVEKNERELWLDAVGTGFADGGPARAMIEMIRPTLYSASARSFLALVEGEPAGGGTVIVHKGVAELCSASTLPAFRGRGVQTALVHARLAAAREADCDLAMVVTAPATASQRNVERIGFKLAYTRAVVATG